MWHPPGLGKAAERTEGTGAQKTRTQKEEAALENVLNESIAISKKSEITRRLKEELGSDGDGMTLRRVSTKIQFPVRS